MFAAGEVLYRELVGGHFIFADDHDVLRARFLGELERLLQAEGLIAEIDAHEIGLSILGPLRELDEVAYLRFASVYQAFDSLEDFEAAITLLRMERTNAGGRGG